MTAKRYFCDFCTYSTTQEEGLPIHISRHHEALLAERGNVAQRQVKTQGWKPPQYNAALGPGWANAECHDCKGAGFVFALEKGKPDYSKYLTCLSCRPRWLAAKAAGTLF